MHSGETRRRVLYVMSPGRSGSTLLTLLLSTHPQIATLGERRFLRARHRPAGHRLPCLCGRLLEECPYMQDALKAGLSVLPDSMKDLDFPQFLAFRNKRIARIARRAHRFFNLANREAVLGRAIAHRYALLTKANLAVFDWVLDKEAASVMVDSSKAPIQARLLERNGRLGVLPVFLTRDGRGQFHSFVRSYPDWPVDRAAGQFVEWIERIEATLRAWDVHSIRVRYEDLCADPLVELDRIASDAGLEGGQFSLAFRRDGARHAAGNSGLLESASEEIRPDDTWRAGLTRSQLDVFERIAGPTNRRIGYSD